MEDDDLISSLQWKKLFKLWDGVMLDGWMKTQKQICGGPWKLWACLPLPDHMLWIFHKHNRSQLAKDEVKNCKKFIAHGPYTPVGMPLNWTTGRAFRFFWSWSLFDLTCNKLVMSEGINYACELHLGGLSCTTNTNFDHAYIADAITNIGTTNSVNTLVAHPKYRKGHWV